jgi:ribonuclease HI
VEVDSVEHYLGSCDPVKSAWITCSDLPCFATMGNIPLSSILFLQFDLANISKSSKHRILRTISNFATALHFARESCKARRLQGPCASEEITRSFYATTSLQRPSQLSQINPLKDRALKKIAAVPDTAITAFTGGTATPNPGPAGAGVVFYHQSREIQTIYKSLGNSSNNIGDIYAIGMALTYFRANYATQFDSIHIFTDSHYASESIRGRYSPKTNREIIHEASELYLSFHSPTKSRSRAQIHWTPTQVGIRGNERAEEIANIGSAESRAHPNIPNDGACPPPFDYSIT